MENFTPIASTLGGLLIGLAAAAMLVFNGRIAGISGILRGAMVPEKGDALWRVLFLGGLATGGLIMFVVQPEAFRFELDRSLWALGLAGLLVGFGTQLGNGCTSGHGVCGLSRFSRRSLVATVTFMATGALAAYVVQHLLGGSL